ncbi:MAG TPA: MmgE/PrpD family protein [Streptosporangiaceae bacterium]|jgi:2-methylcitrate dehydratase PrpD
MTTIDTLADFVLSVSFADLPEPVVGKAKAIALNSWGVQLAASTLPWSRIVYDYVLAEASAAECTVVNYGTKASLANACLANGAFAHGFELDDYHPRTAVKGGSVVVPSALAAGELAGSSGTELITAMVVGYEIMARVGLMIRPTMHRRGHQGTGTCGAIGAGVVIARLLGLDSTATRNVLAIAATQLTGISDIPASGRGTLKRTFAGIAAANGARAARLAQGGITGPHTSLDLGSGLCRSFEATEESARAAIDGLGGHWHVLDVRHKVYAQDGHIQPITECLAEIRSRESFDVSDVDRVVIGTNKHAYEDIIGQIREPRTATDAQFSPNFSAALFLARGGAGFGDYTQDAVDDPAIRALSERIILRIDDAVQAEYARSGARGADVAIVLRSGRTLHAEIGAMRTLTDAEIAMRTRALADPVVGEEAAAELVALVQSLESLPDASRLATLLVGRPVHG